MSVSQRLKLALRNAVSAATRAGIVSVMSCVTRSASLPGEHRLLLDPVAVQVNGVQDALGQVRLHLGSSRSRSAPPRYPRCACRVGMLGCAAVVVLRGGDQVDIGLGGASGSECIASGRVTDAGSGFAELKVVEDVLHGRREPVEVLPRHHPADYRATPPRGDLVRGWW